MPVTPEHILWAIEHECPFRVANDWTDPEQTERELRSLRAYAEAFQDGRVFEGVCVGFAPVDEHSDSVPLGFPVSEIFSAFGPPELIKGTCGSCPANVTDGSFHWAGCYGWFAAADLKSPIDEACRRLNSNQTPSDNAFCDSHMASPFYALWIESPWHTARIEQAIKLLEDVAQSLPCHDRQFLRFIEALHAARQHQLPVHVRLVPRGIVEGKFWQVVAHCPHCRAEWVSRARCCQVCGFQGNPAPTRKRHARGTRPFIPLERFLGPQNVSAFLNRYNQRSPDELGSLAEHPAETQ